MASTKRTWLWIVLGIVGTLFLLFCIFVGGAIYQFRTHVKTETVEKTVAEQEFNRTRERFRGQQPLVEFVGNDQDDNSTVHRPPATARRVPINSVRVLIYDINQSRLIHADVPGWLLRMMPEGGRFGGFEGDEQFSRHRLTIEDLERHGHGLVLEGNNRNTRILIWSE